MKKLILTLILAVVIVGLMTVVVWESKTEDKKGAEVVNQEPAEVTAEHGEMGGEDILYWGNTCPHCHETIEWIEDNQVEDTITIVRKEVYDNQTNAQELAQRAKSCGLDENRIGVPFMYTSGGNCLIGTPAITGYLDEKVKQITPSIDSDSASVSAQKGGGQ